MVMKTMFLLKSNVQILKKNNTRRKSQDFGDNCRYNSSCCFAGFAHDIKLKWHCRFNGEQIVAEIQDDDFITQVNNYEVKFDAGTTLKCDLVVETLSFPNRPEKKPAKRYYITNVWKWEDGSHIVSTTNRYRTKNKE